MVDAGATDASVDAATPDTGGASDAAFDAHRPEPRRVLFVGNSYTNFNMLPSVIREITAARDDLPPLEVESVLVDGATLWDHWTTTGARERIETGAFDVVVLQAQSTEPIRDRRDGSTGFGFATRFLTEAAVATGARVVYFVTWARRAGHPDYERLRLGDPATMTRDLMSAHSPWPGSGFADVGLAFEIALAELPDVELYAEDGSHPSPAGSLLAACVLSQMVGGEHPRLPTPAPLGLAPEVADALCAIAPRVACRTAAFEFCHGVCVQTGVDPLHCGACDAACPGDLPCNGGMCRCEYPDWTPCPGRRCAFLPLDEHNCGACGRACEPGQDCRDGECECRTAARIDVPAGRLAELRAGCARGSPTVERDCAAAIAEHCEALGCFDTGVPSTPFPAMAPSVVCLSGEPVASTFEALAALEPGCTGVDVAHEPACSAAVHRACIAAGAVSGLASTSRDPALLTITCVRAATVVRTSFAALAAEISFCDGTTTRWGASCNSASASICRSMGHSGGYGPVEAIGDDVDIVCLDY